MAIVESVTSARQTDNPKLLDRVRDVIRRKHYSIRTEHAYIDWIRRFILFHGKRHPADMREAEMAEFLTHLARDGKVAASTQNQALSALLFLVAPSHVMRETLIRSIENQHGSAK